MAASENMKPQSCGGVLPTKERAEQNRNASLSSEHDRHFIYFRDCLFSQNYGMGERKKLLISSRQQSITFIHPLCHKLTPNNKNKKQTCKSVSQGLKGPLSLKSIGWVDLIDKRMRDKGGCAFKCGNNREITSPIL